jgi:deoxyribodipyrimidine photo-lyase
VTNIHWFRRDLRLHDNPALLEALRAGDGRVVPLFILDDAILRSPRVGPARVHFLLESLAALDRALRERGSRLVVRRGAPLDVLREVARGCGADAVYFNRDYTPFARARDERVAAGLASDGRGVRHFPDHVICEPDELLSGAGKPYAVYTPYRRRWWARVEQARADLLHERRLAPFAPVPEALSDDPIPTPAELGAAGVEPLPPGGEAAGLERLRAFLDLGNPDGVRDYHVQRDLMARPATSRLSAYLHLGCVATAQCLRGALRALDAADRDARPGVEGWIGELVWHDFYTQTLYHFPHVLRGAFRREYDALAWENDERLFAAWCEGRTGYPVVDAAMRQLNRESWMHNRARMIVASFLVKDLLVDWRWGERYFLQRLVDGDHAANNGGWQWIAGTGADAQPFFRIFNPVSQGRKFDPHGAYVRRYVPELARVPDRYIHAPWTMPADEQRRAGVELGDHYPAPVVDHAAQREKALAMYRGARGP